MSLSQRRPVRVRAAPARQRGFLLIVAIVLILVSGVMGAVIVTLVAASVQGGGAHLSATQALFIAESGLECGIHRWNQDNSYAGEGSIGIGGGTYMTTTFNTDPGGAALPAGKKRLRSQGQIAGSPAVALTIEIVVGRHLSVESFPNAPAFTAEWGTMANEGSSGFSATNCPAATCPARLVSSGSFFAQTTVGGPNQRFAGYRERTLASSIDTGAA